MTGPRTRRGYLGTIGVALAGGVAGCAEFSGPETDAGAGGGTDTGAGSVTDAGAGGVTDAGGAQGATGGTDRPSTGTATQPAGSETTTGAGLDLREANVVAVEADPADGDYRFAVTLIHDDDGEDGFANWWQVETLAGEKLGRRELLHAHGTQRFTRSATVSVPDTVSRVVVRGHDQTHGYGGQAMVYTLASGETDAVRQGSEPQSFSG